ncbi:MAG: ROK family protein [Proteobacteria bacterium]|nr:ROK family protein [Pseudomonadota bacterium]
MRILAIDLGGTKTATALCTLEQSKVKIQDRLTIQSRDYPDFYMMLNEVRQHYVNIKFDVIGIGIAGPVRGSFPIQSGTVTNLKWTCDSHGISSKFENTPVFICNDMQSHGWGLINLSPHQLLTLNPGQLELSTKALIAAGTGLGESVIGWNGTQHFPMGGEGGHATFSPVQPDEIDLYQMLQQKFDGHVSWERVLGGFDGFRNIAQFYMQKFPESAKAFLDVQSSHDDWGSLISSRYSSNCLISKSTLDLYSTLLGREAGNLALKCMPYGGVYLGGGIPLKIREPLQKNFMNGFLDKGRFRSTLQDIPVFIINECDNGLLGAAYAAVSAANIKSKSN